MTNPRRRDRARHWVRLVAGLVLLGMAAYAVWQQQQPAPVNPPKLGETATRSAERADSADRGEGDQPTEPDRTTESATTIVPGQSIYDLDGQVAFQGDVNLTATLSRIKAGERLTFRNDGATFENRERRLPRKPPGYYKEYVHPTPDLSGPGPQRIVRGEQGETYYTPDHYRSFRRLDGR